MKHPVFHTALIAIAAYAIVKMVQTKVMPIPVIGMYLPGGTAA
jgi:histidinol dehydrogenase